MPRAWISSIVVNDGTTIQLEADSIVIIVGPNNSGKSALIKECFRKLHIAQDTARVLSNLEISTSGTTTELFELMNQISRRVGADIHYQGIDFNVPHSSVEMHWRNPRIGLLGLRPVFARMLSTEGRLTASNAPSNIRLLEEGLKHPIHALQQNAELEERFSAYFRSAFGTDLTVHRNAGAEVPLLVGDRPHLMGDEDRLSPAWQNRLETLPRIEQQGDGMRSFVGVLLNSFVGIHSMVFIDEPEAFLHPPQARLLGKMLALDVPNEKQLFLATHSEDLLQGLLEAQSRRLKIVRISRDNIRNSCTVLEATELDAVLNNSLLRHSNILNGLFHKSAVICESDSDCRFYSAMLAVLNRRDGRHDSDILFIHCGGKHRLGVAVKALHRLGVPIKVVADIDILNDTNPLKEVYEALGGNWDDIESDWRMVKNAVDQCRPELTTEDAKSEINRVLGAVNARLFPKDSVKEINRILIRTSPWAEVKHAGRNYIPNGEAQSAFSRMVANARLRGLIVLEVGELEGFVRTQGGHGPAWVAGTLAKDLLFDPELQVAREFVTLIRD